jgi:hypothetical protein
MGSDWSGLILVVFIGGLIAWVYNKARKKGGFKANGKSMLTATIVIAIILILLFGASHTPHN